jgi:hypothetical protein
MKKFFFAFLASVLSVTLIPGTAQATPSDPTIYPIVCAPSGSVNVYLEYGVSSITITNTNGCTGNGDIYLSYGDGSTWTYSKTISGTTTSGSYDPVVSNYNVGTLATLDSFTLTLTSTTDGDVSFGDAQQGHRIYFNKQINSLSPNPVGIGQQVTVTGSNLSSVTSIRLNGTNSFTATTTNRTATQLTFTVPLTVYDFRTRVTSNVTPGTYSLSTNSSKTIALITAPIVVSISSEELAQQAARAADAQREVEKRSARDVILTKFKSSVEIGLVIFAQAEIFGITPQNIVNVQTEIAALPELSRVDITPVIKIARKYEVEGIIAGARFASIYSDTLIEIGLIPEDSKYKAALTAAIKKLPASERSSLADIAEVISAEMAEIQARNDLLKAVLTRIAARRAG